MQTVLSDLRLGRDGDDTIRRYLNIASSVGNEKLRHKNAMTTSTTDYISILLRLTGTLSDTIEVVQGFAGAKQKQLWIIIEAKKIKTNHWTSFSLLLRVNAALKFRADDQSVAIIPPPSYIPVTRRGEECRRRGTPGSNTLQLDFEKAVRKEPIKLNLN